MTYVVIGCAVAVLGIFLTFFFMKRKIENQKTEIASYKRTIVSLQNEITANQENIKKLQIALEAKDELEKRKDEITQEVVNSGNSNITVVE